ncbi:hypothetical protein [Roseibium aggregatum]|uniref:hypothetical protein n=1 Tax=Roseibium aggregatum TaxID=187304 RepID=UPI0025AD0281|nr:hypothetical protein [Roseibium aggregatum]WJS05925.1 hypothetical protein QUB73_30045 [Roseibium aggregatum]
MFQVDGGRITDPDVLVAADLARAVEGTDGLVVQFSNPDACKVATLQALNEACRLAGDRLTVRFYQHDDEGFDARYLSHLPDVANLALDCLDRISHVEAISQLPKLERLHFGVLDFDQPQFLETLNLRQLRSLTVAANRKRNLDLGPLADAVNLQDLFVQGHWKGVEVISHLPNLATLSLSSFAGKHRLDFVSSIASLKKFTLILGSRANLGDLSHQTLEKLRILRVSGLGTLGDLGRFPALSALQVHDQLKLVEVDLRHVGLEWLSLFNCKNLKTLPGLELQDRLQEFEACRVGLDLDSLRDRTWPATTRAVRLISTREKWNVEAEKKLAERKLSSEVSRWI